MNCPGCYKENVEDYCLKCRKKLFEGKRVSHLLSFKAPQNENLQVYQELTKRQSISGVQLKYSLGLSDKILGLTEKEGQYILKPIPPSVIAYPEQAPENEHLTMQIAEKVFNIETAANALIYFADGVPAYLTRRFDVRPDGSKYLQEDFAQLSGKQKTTNGGNYKYSGTYEDIGLLIKKYVAACMPVTEIFFGIVFFNYLFSNGDAHLKNFSLMQTENGDYKLSPAYYLMCTIIHSPGETDTALDLYEGDFNSKYYQTYGHYGYPDFMELAKRVSIIEARAKRIIEAMTNHTDEVISMIGQSFLSDEVKSKYRMSYLDKVKRIVIN